MRSYSLFTIFLLCLAILAVDVMAFYWLVSISRSLESQVFKIIVYTAFWIFTVGLLVAILYLKIRLDTINRSRRHLIISSIYGLTVSSFVPKVIFVVIISILFFSNYALGKEESTYVIPIVGLFSGFLPFMAIVFGIFKTIYRFKVYHIALKIDKIPKGIEHCRIVHISDLHLGSFNFRYHILDRAIHTINQFKPDFIFFTGDLVNNYAWELKGWSSVLEKLKAGRGKFAVLGNHDYGDYSEWPAADLKQKNLESIKFFFKKIGFRLLLNESEVINMNDQQMAIVGVENWGKPPFKQYGNLKEALKGVENIDNKILLSHDPSHWEEEVVNKTDILLTLSGHTHGMQAGFRLKKKQWSPIKYKYKYWAGLYKENNQFLYVNRGLGWLGFPGRLGMRPEITVIDFRKGFTRL